MRFTHLSLLTALLLGTISLLAQAPQSINYQAMAIDGGAIYANQTFNLRFSMVQSGTAIYQEEHFSVTSNSSGLFTARIGQGVATISTFASIDWSAGPYLLRTEIDAGSGYLLLSEHAFSSVPYALFAERSSLPVSSEFAFNGDTLQIAQNGATLGQILKWNGQAWVPDFDANNTYVAGNGIDVTGGVISNTGDPDASDDLTTASNAGGDATGAFSNLAVVGLQGNPIAANAPNNGEVLRWNGSVWAPAANTPVAFTGGAGISISGTTISNTGDLDASDDITIATAASGDLSGTYPSPTVVGINGFNFSNQTPSVGEVYKWNGSQWTPGPDQSNDADADPTNEIQSMVLNGNILSLSGGGNSVNLPTYTAGTGINIAATTITNTGDTNPNDDITNSTPAGGDLSGTYPNPVVNALNGLPIANTTPLSGQIYKWNGSQWIPANDESGPWVETAGNAIHDGDIFLQNGSGQTRVAAGITPSDRGYINVYDEFNNLKAGIQINASGQGEVFGDSKSFRMEHPEDPSKEIWYANLEGPEAGAYVRGTAELVNGSATINFPAHFQLIATADNMTIMLTPLSGDSEGLAVIEKTPNGFQVRELRNGTGNYRFDWEAKCIRQGYENFEVIRERK